MMPLAHGIGDTMTDAIESFGLKAALSGPLKNHLSVSSGCFHGSLAPRRPPPSPEKRRDCRGG